MTFLETQGEHVFSYVYDFFRCGINFALFSCSKLSGLITGQGKFIEVIFHVILPKPHWEWDKSSKIYLRFGCRELGKWEENVGDFKIRYAYHRQIISEYSYILCKIVKVLITDPKHMYHV